MTDMELTKSCSCGWLLPVDLRLRYAKADHVSNDDQITDMIDWEESEACMTCPLCKTPLTSKGLSFSPEVPQGA